MTEKLVLIQGNSSSPRNNGDFELTEFEITGFDCICGKQQMYHPANQRVTF